MDCDREETWRPDGCRNFAEWLAHRLGTSKWMARRLVNAAHTLPHLSKMSRALESGRLSLDKVVELCRFATPETEAKLISWARRVMPATIRERADALARRAVEEAVAADKGRCLNWWWFDDGTRVGLEGCLPADQGAVVIKALDRMAERTPAIVADEEDTTLDGCLGARRADALVALCSAGIAEDQDPDRATVVVHAELSALVSGGHGCGIEGGGVLHPATVRRLACDCRLEWVWEDSEGRALGIGRAARTPPPWLRRQLLYRDQTCLFPGCGARRFLHCHHIEHWIPEGRTDLDNLALVCTYHHKLLHEPGWGIELGAPGTATWYRPGGRRYEPGPDPPEPTANDPTRHPVAIL